MAQSFMRACIFACSSADRSLKLTDKASHLRFCASLISGHSLCRGANAVFWLALSDCQEGEDSGFLAVAEAAGADVTWDEASCGAAVGLSCAKASNAMPERMAHKAGRKQDNTEEWVKKPVIQGWWCAVRPSAF